MTLRLLDRAPAATAIYAENDTMALGVLSAMHERGFGVPQDCAVVGCDDIPIAACTIPPLTTVHVPFFKTGETAGPLLLDLISGVGRGEGAAARPAAGPPRAPRFVRRRRDDERAFAYRRGVEDGEDQG